MSKQITKHLLRNHSCINCWWNEGNLCYKDADKPGFKRDANGRSFIKAVDVCTDWMMSRLGMGHI